MGNLATLTIFTDRLNDIEKNPSRFIDEFGVAINRRGASIILGQTKVQALKHSSESAVYLQMGNTCCIMDPYDPETLGLMRENSGFFGEQLQYLEKVTSELREAYNATRDREKK